MKKEINRTLFFCRRHELNTIPIIYKDKVPPMEWKKFQDRAITGEEIKKFFEGEKKHNIAIVGGAISDNLAVIDFDSVEMYQYFFPKWENLEKCTTTVNTSRGVHVYFKTVLPEKKFVIIFYKKEHPHTKENEVERVSFQAEGSYVLVPPSTHPSGKRYMFRSLKPIRRVETNLRYELCERSKVVAEKLGLDVELPKETPWYETDQERVKEEKDPHIVQIKSKLTVTDVASRYGMDSLMPGKNGECKLHKSVGKKSFSVSPDNKTWYCFGCQVGGGIFQLIMEAERRVNGKDCSFGRALNLARTWLGISEEPRIENDMVKAFGFR